MKTLIFLFFAALGYGQSATTGVTTSLGDTETKIYSVPKQASISVSPSQLSYHYYRDARGLLREDENPRREIINSSDNYYRNLERSRKLTENQFTIWGRLEMVRKEVRQ